MNVFFSLLVIFIHTSSHPVTNLSRTSWQYLAVFIPWKLASFVVYGFIFIGGVRFALHPPEKGLRGTSAFYLKKLTRILIPYIVWVGVYCLWGILYEGKAFTFGNLAEYLVCGTAASHLYFIVIILQFFILAPVFRRIKPSYASAVLPILLIITLIFEASLPDLLGRIGLRDNFLGFGPFRNDRAFTSYLFYWAAGVFAGFSYDKVRSCVSKYRVSITVFWVIVAFSEVFLQYRLSAFGKLYTDWFALYNPLHHLFICSSILFFFTWALKIKGISFFKTNFFRLQDRCSFSVYLSHILVLKIFDYYSGLWWDLSVIRAYLLRMAFTFIVTIGCCMAAAFVIERIKKGPDNKVKNVKKVIDI